ncbi:hypothetical protein ACFIJ5_05520 [Haloimpatiens sp. FM7330]|uniref:hypothetical protein n=1 Tax=Haloimpatiens sp. FM7330 TaxID=3298610 RepID=UPI00362EFB37
MANVVRKMVDGIGVSNKFPKNLKYFNEVSVPEIVTLDYKKPDIKELLSIMVDTEILSLRVIDTVNGLSSEGQKFDGAKLVVDLKISQKVKYSADEENQSVHIVNFENIVRGIYIAIPYKLNGTSAYDLLKQNRIIVKSYIEDIFAEKKDERTIFKNITILVNAKFRLFKNNNSTFVDEK